MLHHAGNHHQFTLFFLLIIIRLRLLWVKIVIYSNCTNKTSTHAHFYQEEAWWHLTKLLLKFLKKHLKPKLTLKRVFKRQTNRQQMYLEEKIYDRVKNYEKVVTEQELGIWPMIEKPELSKINTTRCTRSPPKRRVDLLWNYFLGSPIRSHVSTVCKSWQVSRCNGRVYACHESVAKMSLLWTQQRYWWWSSLQDPFYGCFECFRRRWRGLTRTSKTFVTTQPMASPTRNVLE